MSTNKRPIGTSESAKLRVVDLPIFTEEDFRAKSPQKPLPRGVYWDKDRGKYVSQASYEGQANYLGSFNNVPTAHLAYLEFRKTHPYKKVNRTLIGAGQPARMGYKSKYKGITHSKGKNKWTAQIGYNYKMKHLGCFPFTEEGEKQAALEYDKWAMKLFGEYARTNQMIFPEDFKE